jgi:PTS system ascorbate-specific IIA component
MSVKGTDDPLDLVPAARALLARLDTGEGVLVVTDIYGASPSNLARKLLAQGRVEAIAGVSLPMLVRALTYRGKGMETMVRKAISGGRDGVLRFTVDPVYAATRN